MNIETEPIPAGSLMDQFIEEVRGMRAAQKRYFKAQKSQEKIEMLKECRQLERLVDFYLERLKKAQDAGQGALTL